MKYTIKLKCLVPFQNDEAEFIVELEPRRLYSWVRNLHLRFPQCNIWAYDEKGRECSRVRLKSVGFGVFALREIASNSNIINCQ